MTGPPPHAQAAIEEFAAGRQVEDVKPMAGNAGFSYGATIGGEPVVMRVPPPGARPVGPADVLRQARILSYLSTSDVPVPAVRGVGTPERPWFAVDRVDGISIRPTESDSFSPDLTRTLALAGVDALRELHAVPAPAWLGEAVSAETSVSRWDAFGERAAAVSRPPDIGRLREALLAHAPRQTPIGLVHGDFQWGNVLGASAPPGPRIVAIIDWELSRAGAIYDDVGWLILFSDGDLWPAESRLIPDGLPSAAEVAERYGVSLEDIAWHRALAGYVFAVLIGFNLRLHRDGKRLDPLWELLAPSAELLVRRSLSLIG